MIRKIIMLVVAAALFLFVSWQFIAGAVLYNPLSETLVKKAKIRESEPIKATYTVAWDKIIYEKNLFNTLRTYMEPKPVRAAVPPPPPPKKPDLVLKGIILDTFGDYVAYVEINQAKATLRKGDKIEDIEVSDISEKAVVLKWMSETITLTIEKVKTLSSKPRAGR
ncbi:MAG: hypothetical protein HZA15_01855 [Nitrospirae bacterium]|nr:hypothetical protein [Nitrospirota bacterium]